MNTTILSPIDQLLIDIHPKTGKINQWSLKKAQTDKLAACHNRIFEKYSYIDPVTGNKDSLFDNRASKLYQCGTYLEFKKYLETGQKTLHKASFCKYRLCSMCGWRRSLKIFGQASQVMDEAERQGYRFLFVTLTIKNCQKHELTQSLDKIFDGLVRLHRMKKISQSVKGWMRILEITHNTNINDKSFGTFHPHVHLIWAVKPKYFKDKGKYISQSLLTELWQKVAKLDYKPQVDIRAVNKKNKKGSIREVAKYSVKSTDIVLDDFELMDEAVFHLDIALFQRRLLSWGGVLKKIRKSFNFDDPETGDLVNVDGQELNEELKYIIEQYHWNYGYSQYVKVGEYEDEKI